MSATDINVDAGEGFDDAALAPYVTTLHIACGGHAGDERSIRQTIELAQRHGLRIGAHPSYPDTEQFGRRELNASSAEIARWTRTQLERIVVVATGLATPIESIKPHGALYHRLTADREAAKGFLDACQTVLPQAAIVGWPNGALATLCQQSAITYQREGFADRRYDAASQLVPRSAPDALILQPAEAVQQALALNVDTICIHSDGPTALDIAMALYAALCQRGER